MTTKTVAIKTRNLKHLQSIIREETEIFFKKNEINPDAVVNVRFVSKNKIQKLNQKYRHIDKPTDVLSFPIWQHLKDIPKKGIVNLGDIFIYKTLVLSNSQKQNKEFDQELRFVINHSLNHLIGKHH